MPIVRAVAGGYKGVEISNTKLGFVVVVTTDNKHRFNTVEEAHDFIDDVLSRQERELSNYAQFWKKYGRYV